MYVCMHACMHLGMYVCMCLCMYVRIYLCKYVCMNVCMYVWMHACRYVCMYVCMHACMHICMYVFASLTFHSNCSARLLLVNNYSHFFPAVFKRVTGEAETFLWFISIVSCYVYVRTLLIWSVCLSSQRDIIVIKQSNGTNTCPINSDAQFYSFIQMVFKNWVPTGHKQTAFPTQTTR